MAASELNLRDYWLIVRKRRWIALPAFFCVLIATHIYTNAQVPVYQSSADVRLLERRAVASLMEILMGTVGDPMASQTKVIESQSVLERAALRLGWLDAGAPPDVVSAKVLELRSLLDVSVVPNTDVIRITVIHHNATQTAVIANTVADAYRETNLLEKSSQARALREFAESQLTEVEHRLHALEERMTTFKQEGEVQGKALAVVTELAQLQTEREKLLQRFTELHPNVQQLDERIAALQAEVTMMPNAEVEYAQTKRELELTDQSYRTLKAKSEEARMAEAEKVPDVTIVNPAIVPKTPVKPNRRLNYLLGLLVGATLSLMSAFVIEHLDTSIGTIEDVEQYLQLPVLGVIPFLTSPKAPLSRSSWMTELRQYFMPTKPHRRALSRLREQTLMHYPPKSAIADAFRLLRTNIRIEVFNNDPAHKVLMITSAGNDEGKTIITCNLAVSFAQEGRRTLLVDADLRRPSVHLCLGYRRKEPGLSNILTDACTPEQAVQTFVELMMGEVGFDTAIQTPGLDNLSVVTTGSTAYSPPDLLESKALDRFFQWAREHYDVVIVDSAPVLAVADPLLVAPKVEAVVLVYKVGRTARKAIQRAKFQLESIKAKVSGVILNNISPEVEIGSDYYYRQYRQPYEQEAREDVTRREEHT